MSKTILIVDDFKNTRFIISFILKEKGYSVLEAADGIDAIKLFDGRNIDLVITDYNMPKMNGGRLAQEIRKLSKYEFIPILILTTENDPKKREEADKANITAWIKKPYKQEQFMKVIEKCLK